MIEHDIASQDPEALERLDYIFQHHYNRVEQAARRLAKMGGDFSFAFSFAQDHGVTSSYEVPDEDAAMEFALAIAPFARQGGPYHVAQWLDFLERLVPSVHAVRFAEFRAALERIKTGPLHLTENGKRVTAAAMYERIADHVIFANDTDAHAYLEGLAQQGPLQHLVWQQYYEYCVGLWELLQVVHAYRREHRLRPAMVRRENRCIYCTATSGRFTHVEHTLPESLGNEESFLPRGYVCGTCKAVLDVLEDGIHQMVPFSMLVVTNRLGNKKGKLPTMRAHEVHMARKSPNRIVITETGGPAILNQRDLADGHVAFTLRTTGRFDAHRVARMLYKAALGTLALERGRDYVLDPRFDEVRRYIIQGGTFPNNMIVAMTGRPTSGLRADWREVDSIPVIGFNIYGFTLIVALGARPRLEARGAFRDAFLVLDLTLDEPSAALASPDDDRPATEE